MTSKCAVSSCYK